MVTQPVLVRFLEVHQRRRGVELPEGGVADFVKQVEVLNRRVVDAGSRANARSAGPPKFSQNALAESRRIGDSGARREIVPAGGPYRLRNPRVAGEHPSLRSVGESLRLLAGHEALNLALRVIEGLARFPAQAIVRGKVGPDFERILPIKSEVFGPRVKKLAAELAGLVGSTEQVVCEIVTGFTAIKGKRSIHRGRISLINLKVAAVASELHRVPADHLGEVVADLVGVVVLACRQRRGSKYDPQFVQENLRNTFERGVGGNDAEASFDESEAGDFAQSPCWFAEVGGGAREVDPRLVDRARTERVRVVQIKLLGPRGRDGGKPGDVGAVAHVARER